MKIEMLTKCFVLLFLLCGSSFATDTTNSISGEKNLVEVTFTSDERDGTVSTFFMSETRFGSGSINDYTGFSGGAGGPNPDADTRAKRCMALLKKLNEPHDLPASPSDIVTVKCSSEGEALEKKFPYDRVPAEVKQILAIIHFNGFTNPDGRFSDKPFGRLKFIQESTNK
jgi:hypothetical protein